MEAKKDIMELIEEEDVEFVRLQFTDMFGNLKNVAVTPAQLDRVLAGKYSFEGQEVFGDYTNDTLYLKPDVDTFVILPWRPQQGKVAKLICDVTDSKGRSFSGCARGIYKKALEKLAKEGYDISLKEKFQFFLFHADENGLPSTVTHETTAGFMDVGPMDMGENARRDMVLTLEDMDLRVESSHHEHGSGQHEIDFEGGKGLAAGDNAVTFKFAVRSVAKRFGLHATFMPSPIDANSSSKLRLELRLLKGGKNVFAGKKGLETAEYFLAGIIANAGAVAAFSNPLVNSYKNVRNAYLDLSDFGKISGEEDDRFVEVRFPDPSANIYLLLSLLILAGLKGIKEKAKCDAAEFPDTLCNALSLASESAFVREVFGDEFTDAYIMDKYNEWIDYLESVSKWETDRYLVRF